MRHASRAGLVVGLLLSASPVASAGDHLWWRYASSTTTTTTTGVPSILAPATTPLIFNQAAVAPAPTLGAAAFPVAFNVVQPAAPVSFATAPTAAPTAYYYYYTTTPQAAAAPVATGAMVAPSILDSAPAAAPVNPTGQAAAPLNPAGEAAPPPGGQPGAASGPRLRILQKLKEFANNNINVDRAALVGGLRQVGLGLLRAELNQFGLGFLVPSQSDQNAVEDLVNQVVNERFGGGVGGSGNANGNPTFVFNGPITLSLPNVQTVQIQGRVIQQGEGAAAAGGDGRVSDATAPTLAPVAETPTPPAPSAPQP